MQVPSWLPERSEFEYAFGYGDNKAYGSMIYSCTTSGNDYGAGNGCGIREYGDDLGEGWGDGDPLPINNKMSALDFLLLLAESANDSKG